MQITFNARSNTITEETSETDEEVALLNGKSSIKAQMVQLFAFTVNMCFHTGSV